MVRLSCTFSEGTLSALEKQIPRRTEDKSFLNDIIVRGLALESGLWSLVLIYCHNVYLDASHYSGPRPQAIEVRSDFHIALCLE